MTRIRVFRLTSGTEDFNGEIAEWIEENEAEGFHVVPGGELKTDPYTTLSVYMSDFAAEPLVLKDGSVFVVTLRDGAGHEEMKETAEYLKSKLADTVSADFAVLVLPHGTKYGVVDSEREDAT